MMIIRGFSQVILANWNPATPTLSAYGPSPWAPTSSSASLTVGGWTRGAGTSTAGTAAGSAWGGSNWTGTANCDVTFTVMANPGFQVSYSSFSLFYRRSSSGPATGTFDYTFGNSSTTYTTINTFNFTTTTSSGALHTPISLSGVSDLQNLPAGTVIKFRIGLVAGTSTSGTWYIFGSTSLLGTVSSAVPANTFSASVAQTASISCNGMSNGALTANVTGTNTPFTYSWMPSGGTSSVATGLAAGVYSCLVTSSASETTIATYTLTQPTALSASVVSQSSVSCFGGANATASVAASGGTPSYTYSWMPSGGSTASAANLAAGNYTLTVTDSKSCTATQTVAIVQPASGTSITASASSTSVCNGSTVSLSGSGANTYTWSGSVINGSAFSPTSTATYTVNGTDMNGCATNSVQITVTVNPLPVISVNSGAICPGNSFVMSPGGASTYTFSSGTATVTPALTSTYAVTGTSSLGCVSPTAAVSTVSVSASLNVSINTPTGVCIGSAVTLTATGATSYSWSTGDLTYTISVSPTVATTYSVVGSSGSCSNPAVATLSVYGLPAVSVASSSSICAGQQATVSASGASTYSWSSSATGSLITPSPTTTTVYTVTGTDVNGCVNTAVKIVTVNALPTISVTGAAICQGGSYTLSPSGAVTYTFSGGASVVSPTTTTSYSVAGTSSLGCVSASAAVVSVTVNALPSISVNSGSICAGKVFTMTPSGASTYTFSNGSSTVSPSANISYSVTGTSSLGCVSASAAVSNVTVAALPVIAVNSGSICAGKVFTMSPSGASTYTYSNGSSTVSPSANATYSITGTSSLGCVSASAAVANVTVNALPTITVNSGAVCAGSVFTIQASGASTYTYSNGSSTVIPTANASYSVTGASSAGCVATNTAVSSVTVNALPTITVNSGTVCAGSSFTLLPSGALSYTISGGSATVAPISTASYSVTGTNSLGCVSATAAIATITVNALPVLSITASPTVCSGGSYSLSVTGASSYTWNAGPTGTVIVVTPTANTVYSVTGVDVNGCMSSASNSVTVFANPTISVSNGTICPGGSFTLTPAGASTYTFSNATAVVSPSSTTSYSVLGTDMNGCVSQSAAVAVVTVTNSLLVTVSGNTLICSGQSASITANGASTYSWNQGSTTAGISSTLSASTHFTVTGSSGTCSNTAVISVSVMTAPSLTASSTNTIICAGETVTLSISGAANYSWNTSATASVIVVTPSVTSSYTVTGIASNGCSNVAVIQQNVSICTGIASGKQDDLQFSVYPNPNTGEFTVKSEVTAHFVIINELGQTMQNVAVDINGTEIKGLQPGVYFITGTYQNNPIVKKVIVTK